MRVGETVKEQFEVDDALEYAAIKFLNEGIQSARMLGDNASEDLLTRILVSEEEHADWLETQLELMKQLGDANYLSQEVRT